MGFPKSKKKYCEICQKIRTFRFNPAIGHSDCVKCGYRFLPFIIDNQVEKLENKH